MKAWVLHGINQLQYEEVNIPSPETGEVLVKVRAAGVCGSDIPRVYQTGAHFHPLIPGHEFSGEVVSVGNEVDESWIGKHVGVFPLIPCKHCIPCQHKQYEMCKNYNYLGSRRDGGIAEYVVVPQWNLIALPEEVSFEEAAMLEPMAVAVHAMRGILEDEKEYEEKTFMVWGLGTIGILLTMFLLQLGIRNIFVVGNKRVQRDTVIKLGLDENQYCDCMQEDVQAWVMNKTNNMGVDFSFECVGKNLTMENVIDMAAPGGRVMLVGNPCSDMTLPKSIYWKILRYQLTVKGTWNSSYTGEEDDDWHYVITRLQKGHIQPRCLITHYFKLENLAEGLHIMRDKSQDYVKIMSML